MTHEPERRTVRTPDGRDLEVLAAGPDTGIPLVWHSGTPSAALLFGPTITAATERGLRIVTFSRPGYSLSTPRPGRTVGDVAADVTTILDSFGADGFVCAGQSGGGPHALACAALLPGRCLATATLAGVAPYPAEGLDWLAGMGPENIEEFTLTLRGKAALTPFLEREAAHLSDVRPEDLAAALGGLVGEVDRSALTGEFAEYVALSFHAAVSAGIAGWRDDDIAFSSPWGFDLGEISTPVAVWQGGEDRMVPMAHGVWLADHIRGAERHLLPAQGHLSLAIASFGEVLDGLLLVAGLATPPSPSESNTV